MNQTKTMLSDKKLWLGFILVAVIIFVLGAAQLGSSSNPQPKDMPVALVVLDKGAELPNGQTLSIGKQLQEQLTAAPAEGASAPLHWEVLANAEAAMEGLDEQKYYGALIIPADASANISSLLGPQPNPAAVQLFLNQGMNATGANLVAQIIDKIGDGANAAIRSNLLELVKLQGGTLSAEQAAAIASPISFQIENVNPVPSHSANGNAPVAFTSIAWFAALVASIIMLLVANQARKTTPAGKLSSFAAHFLAGLAYAIVSACSLLLLAGPVLGMTIPDGWAFIAAVSVICFAFYLLQSCVLHWLGFPGMPLIVLVFFFGTPILSVPEQMLPALTQHWLYSWIPLRFGVQLLKETLYFGGGIAGSGATTVLASAAAVAFCLSLLAVFVKPAKAKQPRATHDSAA